MLRKTGGIHFKFTVKVLYNGVVKTFEVRPQETVKYLLEEAIRVFGAANPHTASDGEFVFATDFYARKFGGRLDWIVHRTASRRRHAHGRRRLSRQPGSGCRRCDAP